MLLLRPRYVEALAEDERAPDRPRRQRHPAHHLRHGARLQARARRAGVPPLHHRLGDGEEEHGRRPVQRAGVPPRHHQGRKFGPYVDPALGEVPVDFLSDLDITNGNSGSSTLNGRGELVGLAFDGNIESMASDWIFQPAITRTIHVDIRYIEWLLDAVYPGQHLLAEMGVKPAF